MRNFIEKFGRNAGKVWVALNGHGELAETELMKNIGLTENDFYAAVGWLARENKICKDKRTYKIGETNLTNYIGNNAGKVWDVLNTWGEVDLPYINKLANIKKLDMYSALGWLAKEGKLKAKYVKPKEIQVKYKLAEEI